jgi:pentatricopeptide repeat protein
LNDGTERDPEGTVENPVVIKDKDNTQEDEVLTKTEQSILDNCKDYIKNKQTGEAHRLFVRMKNMGVLRDSLTWEKAVLAAGDADK